MKIITRRSFLAACVLVATGLLSACGPAPSSLPDLSGRYECETFKNGLYVSFDVAALEFTGGDVVIISMDHDYTGRYWKDGDTYRFEITGGLTAVSDVIAGQKQKQYEITARQSDYDGNLTVYIKAKSGYIYLGDESATFVKVS